jgi:hypothetical protein
MEWTPDMTAEMTRLHGEGYPPTFIASWLKLEPGLVRRRLVELGLERARSPRRADPMPSPSSLVGLWRKAAGLRR